MIPVIISAIESPEDRSLMTEFYEMWNTNMYREARKRLPSEEDVEDVVFEALTKIIDKMEIFRELKPLQRLQYALTTVRNLSYILLKRNNHFTFIPYDSLDYDFAASDDTDPEICAEKSTISASIKKIWGTLEPDDRILLEQKYILYWKDSEIAAPLNIQPQSVRMKLTRAKRNLMSQLSNEGINLSEWL